jgi:ubiquinone/menaquinone biosynthesis C-methylase UbiE
MTLQFDPEASRRIEATYMTPDVVQQRRVVLDVLDPKAGEDVLDVGSGPGLLAGEIAELVSPGGSVRGMDPSESMLAIARRRELVAGSAPVEFCSGDAGALPFADESFDAVVSTQVYEYVEDVPTALTEVHRVLRPGGRLLVLDTDWDSIVWHSGDRARMRRILAAWDEHLVDPYLPRRLTRLIADAGLQLATRSIVPIFNAGYDTDTYSAGLIGFISSFAAGRQGVTEDELSAWRDDLIALGEEYFFSLNRYVFVAVKP